MSNTPYFLERTTNGTTGISLESVLMEQNRLIFLDKPIDSESVNEIVKQILVLTATNKDAPITLVINTPGGHINDGLVLTDCIQACPCVVRGLSFGIAASMGAIILASCTKGYRFISSHSRVMLHEPLITNAGGGSATSIKAMADSLLERKKLINKLLCDYTGKDMKTINKATSFDNYLSAEESVALGICDSIVSGETLFNILKGD